MAKTRPDYETSWFSRFLDWLRGGSTRLDDAMSHAMDDAASLSRAEADQLAQKHEAEYDARRAALAEREKAMYAHVHSWAANQGKGLSTWVYRIAAVVICVSIIVLLVSTAAELPPYGSPDNPAHNEVSARYIEKGMQETGAVNIVAGMILDYRAFDTLGESHVLFIATCTVLILLRSDKKLYRNEIIESLFKTAFYIISEVSNREKEQLPKQGRCEVIFDDFMHLLEQHCRRERNVSFYAEQLNITPKYFSSAIKQVSGKTAARWIDDAVILEAKTMLKFSGLSIQEIAYRLNFSTQSFFGKYFKQHTGVSPSRYKHR